MRIGIIGDTHGDVKDTVNVLNEMGKRKITHAFVVGDFGLWDHWADGVEFLDRVNATAEGNNLSVFAVGGNHENWDRWNWYVENNPTHKGFAMVRRRVLLAPKIHAFTLSGRKFAVAGGAVSIDRDARLVREMGGIDPYNGRRISGTGARTQYWPNETLTEQQVIKIEQTFDKADILLTHDCSDFTHFQGRLKPDPESAKHRQKIDRVIAAVKPNVHFHGHMHTKYEWENAQSHGYRPFEPGGWEGGFVTRTYGMEANPGAMWGGDSKGDWWGILETDDLSFAYRGEGMSFRSLD